MAIEVSPQIYAMLQELIPEEYLKASPPVEHIDFERNKNKTVKGTLGNLRTILEANDITLRYNVIKKRIEILKDDPAWQFSIENYEEAARTSLISLCVEYEMPTKYVNDYVNTIGDENQFNPIKNWITSKEWDGKSRFKEFCDSLQTQSDEIRDLALKKWALSCVRTWVSNGKASHLTIVIAGAQGLGKDRWAKALFPKEMNTYILEGHSIDPKNKDSKINAVRHALVILSEFGSTNNRANQDLLKAWLTSDEDRLRLPFAKAERYFPRRTAFIATVNNLDFLKDDTGNRRFVGLHVDSINPDHGIDMQQFWAEMHVLLEDGAEPWLSREEIELFAQHNEQFEETSSVEESIKTMFDWDCEPCRFMTSTEIAKEIGLTNITRPQILQAAKGARSCLSLGNQEWSKRGSKGEKLFKMPPLRSVGQNFSDFEVNKYKALRG